MTGSGGGAAGRSDRSPVSGRADSDEDRTPAGSQTLDRGLRVLELLAAPDHVEGLSMTALAAALGVSRPAAYRLVATLEGRGYVARRDDGRVRLGFGVTRLSAGVAPLLRRAALPVLRRLADEVGATAHLTVVEGEEALAVAVVEPTWTDFHVAYREGVRHPLARGAAGRAILEGRRAILEGRRGQAAAVLSDGELQPGAHGVAAALTRGDVEGSVGVVSLGPLELAVVGAVVEAAAAEVGRALE
ncbi:MAG: helix-turn-helix domain-containing protein [Lapillicoccus sp.]